MPLLAVCVLLFQCVLTTAAQPDKANARQGFRVDVPLPLTGDRDEVVRRQVEEIGSRLQPGADRPIVILMFRAVGSDVGAESEVAQSKTGGSQFERCLALARYLTSPAAARVRLIGFVPESIEGHAILPLLACESIYASPNAEIGRAAADEHGVDATVESAYVDMVQRRRTLPTPIVLSMLRTDVELTQVQTTDGKSSIVTRSEIERLRQAGSIVSEGDKIWTGGSLASYSGQMMRDQQWIDGTVSDLSQLSALLNLPATLKSPRKSPDKSLSIVLKLNNRIDSSRVNQIIRSISERVQAGTANMLFVILETSEISFQEASRLSSYLAEADEELLTVGVIAQPVTGPAALVPLSCHEAILMGEATVGPKDSQGASYSPNSSRTTQLLLSNLEQETGRPAALLSLLLDKSISVKEYIHQESGRRAIFCDWQIQANADGRNWLAKETVAGGEPIDRELAQRFGLVDGARDDLEAVFRSFGVNEPPADLELPWLDATIQKILAQRWIPRLLLTLAFFALMAELGSPGLGVGGLIAALSFLAFFWIEGLNGKVEWLEILLFLAGLVALAIELFVLPGFGVFGISGLLMVLVSIVLASQTFVWPTTSAQLSEISVNLFWVACLALGGMIGLLFMHKQLERLPMLRWVTLQPSGVADQDELDDRESLVHWEHLVGQEGVTTTRLNPSGKAQFGRDIVAVVGSGRMIGEGSPVRVVEVRGNIVIVEET